MQLLVIADITALLLIKIRQRLFNQALNGIIVGYTIILSNILDYMPHWTAQMLNAIEQWALALVYVYSVY